MPTAAGFQYVSPWASRVVARVQIKNISNLYANRVKTAVFNAITEAMGNARQAAENYITRYFPRKTGHYADDVISTMKTDAHGQDPWTISLGAEDTPYAGFVNRFRGVNWTNPSTVEGAQGLLIMFLRQQVRNLVRQAVINAVNYATLQKDVTIKNA